MLTRTFHQGLGSKDQDFKFVLKDSLRTRTRTRTTTQEYTSATDERTDGHWSHGIGRAMQKLCELVFSVILQHNLQSAKPAPSLHQFTENNHADELRYLPRSRHKNLFDTWL